VTSARRSRLITFRTVLVSLLLSTILDVLAVLSCEIEWLSLCTLFYVVESHCLMPTSCSPLDNVDHELHMHWIKVGTLFDGEMWPLSRKYKNILNFTQNSLSCVTCIGSKWVGHKHNESTQIACVDERRKTPQNPRNGRLDRICCTGAGREATTQH
jgi:hypothetical protein